MLVADDGEGVGAAEDDPVANDALGMASACGEAMPAVPATGLWEEPLRDWDRCEELFCSKIFSMEKAALLDLVAISILVDSESGSNEL